MSIQEPAVSESMQRLAALEEARQRAIGWFSAHVSEDGMPAGADKGNAWWRAPWALCVAGAPQLASSMLGWIERNALTPEGDLRDGCFGGGGADSPVYLLSPIAIAAQLLARYDIADKVMRRTKDFWDPQTGGVFEFRDPGADPIQDMLKTCQLGVSALAVGDVSVLEGIYNWLRTHLDAQAELPERLYTTSRNGHPVSELNDRERFARCVEFNKPRQAYFYPGIAAAFLAGYYQKTGNHEALKLADRYLALNENGTFEQFTDTGSVQICKFGWGVAAMYSAQPTEYRLRWLNEMADWFISRQEPDGSWAPSSFMTPAPGLNDYFWKTAEHLMELSYIECALRQSRVQG
ncbi:hypothetical protein HNR03_000248 [Pseudomonas sp. JAI111]|uniref:hypothetical protein n=1 Tax=Pseudomonas sp. JAI111 TaxID=2735913 RepID=UPI002168B90A|nr:hypothetical protein [Pseudomonas sp. JAI111]MCS3835668.1 hypothetical protein [Pseudomonas sp. JAI111]